MRQLSRKVSQSPGKIDNRKPAALPIRDRFFRAQTIEIDRDVNIGAAKIARELFEMFPPILAQNRSAPLSIFHRPLIGPGMNFQTAGAFRAAISKKLSRPPALKIAAAPNADAPHMRELQRAIDPAAATPFRRANVPIGMIIERNDDERLRDAANPERAQMVKVARAVKQKWREPRFEFAIELVDQARRRGEAKLRPLLARIEAREMQRFTAPGAVKIDMQTAAQRKLVRGSRTKTVSARLRQTKIFRRRLVISDQDARLPHIERWLVKCCLRAREHCPD